MKPVKEVSEWTLNFQPRRGLENGHAQTVAGNFWPRPPFSLVGETETVVVDAADGSRVLCYCHWQPESVDTDIGKRLTVVLVHGLEGSADSRYIQGVAARLWAAGVNVVRMNQRNCGGSDDLTPTLYHSGLSGDVGAVVEYFAAERRLKRVALVGYSMGGNLVLKLAGEWGERAPLVAVAAVSAAMNLAPSSAALHSGLNRLYEQWFLRGLRERYRNKAKLYPDIYAPSVGPIRSVREFDEKVVARYCGFADADDYYERASAAQVVENIQVPTLILHAQDDPFIRVLPETRALLRANPVVTLVETKNGGHCAFLSDAKGEDVHWAEATVVRYLLAVCGEAH
jgi:predicted alpha/beta-fold hydrolase